MVDWDKEFIEAQRRRTTKEWECKVKKARRAFKRGLLPKIERR